MSRWIHSIFSKMMLHGRQLSLQSVFPRSLCPLELRGWTVLLSSCWISEGLWAVSLCLCTVVVLWQTMPCCLEVVYDKHKPRFWSSWISVTHLSELPRTLLPDLLLLLKNKSIFSPASWRVEASKILQFFSWAHWLVSAKSGRGTDSSYASGWQKIVSRAEQKHFPCTLFSPD